MADIKSKLTHDIEIVIRAYLTRGVIYADHLHAYERAIEDYKKANDVYKSLKGTDDDDTMFNMGEAYYHLKQYESSEKAFNQVLKLNPDDDDTKEYLAKVQKAMRKERYKQKR